MLEKVRQISIPNLSLVVLIGPSGSGKSTFAAQALPAHRDSLVRRLPGDGGRRRERPGRHQGRLRGTPLHRRQAAGPGPADGHRRHQRPARGPQAHWSSSPASTTACRWRSCSTFLRRSARSGIGSSRPGLRPPRRPQPEVATSAVAPRASQGGLPARLRAWRPRGSRGGDRRAGAPLERQARRTRPVRHHRRRPRLLRRARGAARAARLRGRGAAGPGGTVLGTAGLSTPTRRAARRSSSATWWTAAPASSTRCGWCGTWSATARPSASPATTT